MDAVSATIVAAGITAAGTILAAVINKISKKKERVQAVAEKAEAVAETTREIVADLGRHAEQTYFKLEVLNLEGDARTTQRTTGIKVSQGVLLAHLAGRISVSTPGARISKRPTLVSIRDFPKEVSLAITKESPTECDYKIEIPALLSPDEPPLDYEVEAEISKAVLMTQAEVDTAYAKDQFKRDYHCMTWSFPSTV